METSTQSKYSILKSSFQSLGFDEGKCLTKGNAKDNNDINFSPLEPF